jgi:hypothetical protein
VNDELAGVWKEDIMASSGYYFGNSKTCDVSCSEELNTFCVMLTMVQNLYSLVEPSFCELRTVHLQN